MMFTSSEGVHPRSIRINIFTRAMRPSLAIPGRRRFQFPKFIAFACAFAALAPLVRAWGEIIPREDFFREASFDEIEVSPDGTKVAALSTWKEHRNLYVIDLKTKKPAMLTGLTTMNVARVKWVGSSRLIFTGTEDGGLTGGLFAIDADGRNSRALAMSARQQQSGGNWIYRDTSFLDFVGDSDKDILVVSNERRLLDPDVFRMNVHTGAKTMVALNPGHVERWIADAAGQVRAAFGQEGRTQFILYRDDARGEWREVQRQDFAGGTITPLAFEKSGKLLYVATNIGRVTGALGLFDPASGQVVKQLYANDTYDVEDVILSRVDRSLMGIRCPGERSSVVWVDPATQKIQTLVDQALPHTVNSLYSRCQDHTWYVFLAHSDRDPGSFYLLNPRRHSLEKIVDRCPWIKPEQMAEMRPIQYQARDGLTIHGYLTLPPGCEPRHLPLIVNPHGGPWYRDTWGFNREVQFLASRGYAVLQMNFRGSTGYGRKLLESGYGQWGLAMQDDITDGVRWAIAGGVADPGRIAIYGASYGGYAAMAGLAFTPELYRCGINYVGVTDIELLLQTIPEGWKATRTALEAMTGDARRDRVRLEATSPLRNADKIHVPVFFAYGERDDRVDMKHATRLVKKLRANGVSVEFMTRQDEGHGYQHWANKMAFYRKMEEFLAKNLAPGDPAAATKNN